MKIVVVNKDKGKVVNVFSGDRSFFEIYKHKISDNESLFLLPKKACVGPGDSFDGESFSNESRLVSVAESEFDFCPKKISAIQEEQKKIFDENQKLQYQEDRRQEYPGVSECIEALIEDAEGRPEKLNALKEKRSQIKAKYPKPKE